MHTMISPSKASLGTLTLLLLLSACGSTSRDTTSRASEQTVAEPSNEFSQQAYQNSLTEQRKAARTYEITAGTSVSTTNTSGESRAADASKPGEFNSQAFRADLTQQRIEDRKAVTYQTSTASSFDYDAFMAHMKEIRAQQKTTASSSSKSTSLFGHSGASSSVSSSASSYSFNSLSFASSSSLSSAPSFNSAFSSSSLSSGVAQCGDGRDNDGDGKIDADDPNCHTDGNADYLPSYDYRLTNESRTTSLLGTGSSISTASGSTRVAYNFGSGGCQGRSLVPLLGDASTGDNGYVFTGLINGDCPISAAVLKVNHRSGPFGSMDF